MKLITIILVGLLYIISNTVSAEYKIYTDLSTFEDEKGAICETATDGCNTYGLQDGKVTYGTKMYCADTKVEWSCTMFKEEIMTTMSLPQTTSIENEMVACTMEYAPVCGVDGKTYGNNCSAVEGARVEVDYVGECSEKSNLFENDENYYNVIKDRLDDKYQIAVEKSITIYLSKINNYSDYKKERINTLLIEKLETKISELLLEYPQDISLPDSVNNKYLTYTLLKFELMKMDFNK